jgi:hypothetical protein
MSVDYLLVPAATCLLFFAELHIDHIVEQVFLIDVSALISGFLDFLNFVRFILSSLGVEEIPRGLLVSERTSVLHSAVRVVSGSNQET